MHLESCTFLSREGGGGSETALNLLSLIRFDDVDKMLYKCLACENFFENGSPLPFSSSLMSKVQVAISNIKVFGRLYKLTIWNILKTLIVILFGEM